jgi:tripartite-type tricarboxylate transporter receptor subunit TctC
MSFLPKLGLAAAALAGLALPAGAQDYPTKSVRIIVPFAAGGPADVFSRQLAQYLSESLKQSFVVEDQPGAGSIIGTNAVAHSAPDGYTLLAMSNTHTTNESLVPNKPFALMRDFVPVSPINYSDLVMVVHPSVPAKDLKEFIALAKSKPGGGARNDVLGGQVQMMFDAITTMAPNVQAGQVRALATTGEKRSTVLPDVPTVAEAGVPGYEATIWLGIMAPKGTPQAVVDKLNAEIRKAINTPAVKETWAKQGAVPMNMTPAEFGAYLEKDIVKWANVVKTANIKVDSQ